MSDTAPYTETANGATAAIAELIVKSGLSYSTVRELLDKGWTWEETITEPMRWVHPSNSRHA